MSETINDFESLMRHSNQLSERLIEAAEKLSSKKDYSDDRFWKPITDKSGNGYAVVRFLPVAKGSAHPFVRYYSHSFQGPTGKWYIENCRSTINEADPVMDFNRKLWDSGSEQLQKYVSANTKRKTSFVANVLVIQDPANPSNEGKVFLFRFGQRIWDKIHNALHPTFKDEQKFDPFHVLAGANFRLKIKRVDGRPNYDASAFDAPAPLLGGDPAKIKAVWEAEYPLEEFISPSAFKSYADLKAKLDMVLGYDSNAGAVGLGLGSAPTVVPVVEAAKPQPESSMEDAVTKIMGEAPSAPSKNADMSGDIMSWIEAQVKQG